MIISHWVRVPRLRCDNSRRRRSYITHCEWHKALQLPLLPAQASSATPIHTMDKDICFQTSEKSTENNLVLSELSINNKRAIAALETRNPSINMISLAPSPSFHKTRVISKTIQTPQNLKRLSNWALNISSRAFYIGFIFGVDRFIRFIHPRRRHLGCAYDTHQNRKYLKKGRVLLAELPVIRSCVRCKRGFRGACTSAVESLNYTAGARRGNSDHIFSILDSTMTRRIKAFLLCRCHHLC